MQKKKENSSITNRILTIVGAILCIVLLPILIVNITLITKSYTNQNEVPSIGKSIPMVVLTDSMYPIIESGDLIILNKIIADNIKVGDIITFFDPSGSTTNTVTHRVIEITDLDGKLAFRTKGDANNTEDKAIVPADKLVGIYDSRIAGLGNVAMFMSTSKGLIICVIVPLVLLIGYDIIIRKISDKKNKNDKEALLAELEKLRAEKVESTTPENIINKENNTKLEEVKIANKVDTVEHESINNNFNLIQDEQIQEKNSSEKEDIETL